MGTFGDIYKVAVSDPQVFLKGLCHAVRCQIASTVVNSASDSFRVPVISSKTQARKCRVYTFGGHGMSTYPWDMSSIPSLICFFTLIGDLVEINVFFPRQSLIQRTSTSYARFRPPRRNIPVLLFLSCSTRNCGRCPQRSRHAKYQLCSCCNARCTMIISSALSCPASAPNPSASRAALSRMKVVMCA